MKETIKNLPVIGKKLTGWYSRYLRFTNRKVLKKNRELKNRFAGRRAFVIATGPSIKTQDLKGLAGELAISVSNFFVHPDFNIIRPAYHLFAPIHPPVTEEQFGMWMKDAESRFPEGQNVLVSISDKHIVEEYGVLKKQKVHYYYVNRNPLTTDGTIDFSKEIPLIQTSVQIGMYLALYLGVKEINLLGADHDWILHLKETRHFYDEKESVLTQKGYNEWQGTDLGTECESYGRLWNIYKRIRAYAAQRAISITNCTAGGLLDVFPRKNLQDVLQNKPQ